MKQNLFLTSLTLLLFSAQSSIYDISIVSINGDNLSIASFANKKIIISAFDAANPDIGWLRKLDSLQNSDTSFQVIAVPANDFSGPGNEAALAALKDSLAPKTLMLQSSFVKKIAGADQLSLFKWLTDVNENTHFDVEVDSPNQLFIVNEEGILYSVLQSDVSNDVLTQILNHDIHQNN